MLFMCKNVLCVSREVRRGRKVLKFGSGWKFTSERTEWMTVLRAFFFYRKTSTDSKEN